MDVRATVRGERERGWIKEGRGGERCREDRDFCVCVCVCVRARLCACLCVCVGV